MGRPVSNATLGKHLVEFRRRDQSGAAAGEQDAVWLQKLNSQPIEPLVSPQRDRNAPRDAVPVWADPTRRRQTGPLLH